MLIIAAMAQAGTWNVCSTTESSASGNAGWTIVEKRDSDGGKDLQKGKHHSAASFSKSFKPRLEGDLCNGDGVGGATQRWSTELIAVEMVPGQKSCQASIWADALAETTATADVSPTAMSASARAQTLTRADAGNTGKIGVDGGGGARFTSEWNWDVPGPAAEVRGSIKVDANAGYSGGSVKVPGWASLEVWDGVVTGSVRRGAAWVAVKGAAPLDVSFGAVTAARGTTCVQGIATAGSRAEPGEGTTGNSTVQVEILTVTSSAPVVARPKDGPTFENCSC